jgi:hypothetical protein
MTKLCAVFRVLGLQDAGTFAGTAMAPVNINKTLIPESRRKIHTEYLAM